MEIFTPESFHVWLIYYAINTLAGQHHLTDEEIQKGFELYKEARDKELIVNQPEYKPEYTRSGTPC